MHARIVIIKGRWFVEQAFCPCFIFVRLLDYLETSEATDEFTERINDRVVNLRNDFEWRENYMTMEMKMEEQFEAGLEQGLAQGLEQGIKILFYDVHMTIPEIAEKLSITEEQVRKIVENLGKQQECH